MLLKHGDDGTRARHGGAVERVEDLRTALLRTEAGVEAAGLIVGAVRAAGQLAEALLAREPDLDVVLTGGRGAEVADGDVDHAVREAERLRNRLLDREQMQVLVPALVGMAEREHLDLLELVQAEDAARVATGGARLAAEARREAGVAQRQLGLGEHLAGVERGQRHLARANQKEVIVG